ncbi:probable galacturonosyltransferase 7 isoform X1 [Oryza glaberrima]|uniref:probable galacturonosyltransferase 7 isoform X1 n=1 Tax=Oryza glaberrima TaxID=4538 RepID=UPI00224C329B|nr:probable galacturonosyltransferase 7 isoform X1 [Oryza glaberrima]
MKGHHHHHSLPPSPPPKRRCTALAAAVPALVVCSILLPLVFLLGLHRPAGHGSEERAAVVISTEMGFSKHKHLDGRMKHKLLKDISRKKIPGSDGILGEKSGSRSKSKNVSTKSKEKLKGVFSLVQLKNETRKNKVSNVISELHTQRRYQLKDLSWRSKDTTIDKKENQEVEHEENPKSCELEYGSYCLWSVEYKEVMKDFIVKRLKDQLFMARAHYPSIAKLKNQETFTRELKQNIQEHERMLSDTIADADLPPFFAKKLEKMEHTIERAKSCEVGCTSVERKLRQLLDITEDEAYFHTRQSAFLYHLGVQTMPKTHHCLNMRLTVEYFKSTSIHTVQSNKQKLEDPTFHHYVIFSKNVLAVSTTINSTVMNSKDSGSIVFHLFTDSQNFYAMKHWFDRNMYLEATVHVTDIEDHQKLSKDVDFHDMKLLRPAEEFRVTFRNHSQSFQKQMKTEYISTFGHSHFLLPDLLPSLNRIVVLDDDLIVQKDLSSLWNLNMGGKVVGAIQFCEVKLGQLKAYTEERNFDNNSCVWLSGLNVVELKKWRDLHITSRYEQLLQKLQKDSVTSFPLKVLPISLLVFQDLIYPLEDSWVQSGLGHDYGVSQTDIKRSVTLHYNGVMKPWLDLGIHDYKGYWRKYMTNGERFMTECNIH